MGIKENVLALAEELDGVSLKDDCDACLASGTELCRGDLECAESAHKACAKRLREIVEHDECEATTVSAYDLLPEDEREAIAWVREHGGLDAVEKRLMPEGMEWLVEAWPRFEDGEPVRFLDDFERDGDENGVSAVTMYLDGSFALNLRAYSKGERVKRPMPKVLDADGVEIRAGDEVYIASCGDGPWTVTKITTAHAWHVYGHSDELGSLDMQPDLLTHRAPVLAADGRPLKKGETVWDTKGNGPYTITEIDGDSNVYIEGGSIPYCGADFIRKNPDTWERINDDATLAPGVYCDRYSLFYEDDYVTAMMQDLVRRARKLAERGE